MHELSIANEILSLVNKHTGIPENSKVTKIKLKVGKFSGIVVDSLIFGLEVISKGTIMENCKIEVEEIPLKIFCENCGEEFLREEFLAICPKCEGYNVKIISGEELELTNFDLEKF